MVLHKHVDPDDIIKLCRPVSSTNLTNNHVHHAKTVATPYSSRYGGAEAIPKYALPKEGIPSNSAYQLIHDELDFDGKPNLNVASFVTTFMEPEADKLLFENMSKNLADNDEYPAMLQIHQRCVSMLGNLWRAPKGSNAMGTATTGSSEAILLGGLAMKRRWFEKRQAAGKDTTKPNILMGANAQVALEKFARYFEVEARIVPVCKESNYCLDTSKIREYVDENTIGIFVILGSTYTGHYENIVQVNDLLDAYEKETGHDVPIHVDGASGGLFCPFATPSVKFGFEIPRVKSINASGHKYGLVYPGVGWVIWRDEHQLPEHLKFELHYLGGTEETYTLNFSRPAAHVVGQYYNFVHLGFDGYAAVQRKSLINARFLSTALESTGCTSPLPTNVDYTCLSDIHKLRAGYDESLEEDDPERYIPGLPVVSFRLTDEFKADYPHVKQAAVSTLLRVKGWILPNYPLPPSEEQTEILRVVVRESFSSSIHSLVGANIAMCDRLIEDIVGVTESLIVADAFEMEAYAHPDAKLTMNDKIKNIKEGVEGNEGHWQKAKAQDIKAKMEEHKQGDGVFKRGAC